MPKNFTQQTSTVPMESSNQKQVLKVCKIESRGFAKFCIMRGVDYLGIHILEENDIGKRLDIARYIKNLDGKVVIVTKIKRFEILVKIIENYNPDGIQLHFTPDIDLILNIKSNYPEIKIFSVITNDVESDLVDKVDYYTNYFVYDTSYTGGTGENTDYKLLALVPKKIKDKVLLAGGINIDRIKGLTQLDCAGYDIQSFFRKNTEVYYNRLELVADILNKKLKKSISVSLSSLSKEYLEEAPNYLFLKNLEYHLDFSDGTLYSNFVTDINDIETKLVFLKNRPLSFHIFTKNNPIPLIQDIYKRYDKNITRFFIQYFPEIDLKKIPDYYLDSKIVISVHHLDFKDYLSKNPKSKFLSIGLPFSQESDQDLADSIKNLSHQTESLELWLDKDITTSRIKNFIKILPFTNVIVGKDIIKDWSNLDLFYDIISKQYG